MNTSRRTLLAGLAALWAGPAWAQAIGRQNDPWAQVDPYADPRNGFPGQTRAPVPEGRRPPESVFSSAPAGEGLSEEDEIALGHARYPSMIAEKGGAHPDPRLQAALREFCAPLFAVSDRPHLPWEVTLIASEEINAFAFAGGKVVVNAGLVRVMDQAGELAAVLGHEIGHVDKRHTVRAIPRRELLARLRQGGAPMGNDTLAVLVPDSMGQIRDVWDLFDKAFTREQETEADAHAMVILERLGVDPMHAVNSERTFLKLFGSGQLNELAGTHPQSEDRVAHFEQLAAMQRRPRTDYVFPGWAVLKAAFPTDPSVKKT